jgi:hypothetical protein
LGHPSRAQQRQKKQKEKMLSRKNSYNAIDLTPQNAVGRLNHPKYEIKLK